MTSAGQPQLCCAQWLLPPLQAAAPSKLVATSYGAAGEVSGSLHVLDTGNGRWMVDCGAVLGEARSAADLPQTLPAGVESVHAVFLTHAHADHLGRLPLLVERGFAGPIYMTEATAALAVPMLRAEARGNRSQPRHWSWSKERLAAPRPATRRFGSIGGTASTAGKSPTTTLSRRPAPCRS